MHLIRNYFLQDNSSRAAPSTHKAARARVLCAGGAARGPRCFLSSGSTAAGSVSCCSQKPEGAELHRSSCCSEIPPWRGLKATDVLLGGPLNGSCGLAACSVGPWRCEALQAGGKAPLARLSSKPALFRT